MKTLEYTITLNIKIKKLLALPHFTLHRNLDTAVLRSMKIPTRSKKYINIYNQKIKRWEQAHT